MRKSPRCRRSATPSSRAPASCANRLYQKGAGAEGRAGQAEPGRQEGGRAAEGGLRLGERAGPEAPGAPAEDEERASRDLRQGVRRRVRPGDGAGLRHGARRRQGHGRRLRRRSLLAVNYTSQTGRLACQA
ncbi:MAG: hypothetical protein MZV70_09000 [Desulfobacterales bacterium]|nr:hypothetical protein [Desulfobacterales bacterium]